MIGVAINLPETSKKQEQAANDSQSRYNDYIEQTNKAVAALSEERKAGRAEILKKLKATETYLKLIDEEVVSAEYLPVFTGISEAIQNTMENAEGKETTFAINETVEKSIDSSDKLDFVVSCAALSTKENGGLPTELIVVADRYRKHYKLYGEPQRLYDLNGNEERITKPYHLTFIFALVKPDKEVLDAIYQTIELSNASWHKTKPESNYRFSYPFMAVKSAYIQRLKDVYPESKYIPDYAYELTAYELFNYYEANEVAADDKFKGKKIAVSGTIKDIGNDIMGDSYITLESGAYLGSVQCYLDKSVVARLSKGQQIAVIGTCKGLMMSVILEDCKIWND